MTKTYSILNDLGPDENIKVDITETKEVTTVISVSVTDLKQEHIDILHRISNAQKQAAQEVAQLQARADEIVDIIKGINAEVTEITVEDIPAKLTESVITK